MIEYLNVEENILLPLKYSDKNYDEEYLLKNVLKKVNLNINYRYRNINSLSGGEKIRVALARAIINNPSIIFADEPTGNLDIKNREIILNLLKKLQNDGKTILMVTHDLTTLKYSNKIIEL